jgi:DNA helicase-2/ATP-dependent DNA helicase PcrA
MPTQINQSQQIVKTTAPRVEVLACPGSGKTTTLLFRVEHLVSVGVAARKILVLSYSKATVGELRRRMDELGTVASTTVKSKKSEQRDTSQVAIKTAHAFAFEIASKNNPGITVLENSSALKLLAQAIKLTLKDVVRGVIISISKCLQKLRIALLRELRDTPQKIQLLLNALTYSNAAHLSPATTVSTSKFVALKQYVDVVGLIAARYTALKKKLGKVDFGDMLTQAVKGIKNKAKWNTFSHVLVDEYQDSSAAQTDLLAAMADKCCEVMVFGDADQAIYGFGGNQHTPLKNVMGGVVQMTLRTSWRLTRQTAAFASSIVQHTKELAIVAVRDGFLPELIHSRDLTTQTCSVATSIQKLIAAGTPPTQIAVLARTRALLKPVEQRLLAEDVQSNQLGTERTTKHPLRVLHLVHLVEGFVNTKNSIDPAAVQRALKNVKIVAAVDLQQLVRSLQKVARMPSVEGRYRKCADWYLKCMGGVRANAKIQHDLNRWAPICRGCADAKAVRSVICAMDPIGVTTSTIHAAKGREWDHVFVVGMADGELPLYLARDELMLAEERRLLFVAVTRARKSVRLYYAPAVHSRSRKRFECLSRFLTDKNVQRRLKTSVPDIGVAQLTHNRRNLRNARNARNAGP